MMRLRLLPFVRAALGVLLSNFLLTKPKIFYIILYIKGDVSIGVPKIAFESDNTHCYYWGSCLSGLYQ